MKTTSADHPDLIPVDETELLLALDFVSDHSGGEHEAIVSLETGEIYWLSDGEPFEDEMPEDADNDELYLAVPDKRDLDLGSELALTFAERHLPDLYDAVRDCFRGRGAYARFKELLSRHGRLDQWFEFEQRQTRTALEEWCSENGFVLVSTAPNND